MSFALPRAGFALSRWPARQQSAKALLLLFAFSAWNMTGPAHIALFGLLALFLIDLPTAGPRLRRDPALWLGLAALLLSTLLALRAALLLPDTAPRQWESIWEWSSPFLFVVFAWWLRADLRLIHQVLIAGLLGILVGVLRKSDWALLADALTGVRYHFGQPALGIAFIATVALLGVILYVGPMSRLVWRGRQHRRLGTILWTLAVAFLVGMLLILQARGAVLGLVIAALAMVGYRLLLARSHRLDPKALQRHRRRLVVTLVLIILVASAVMWTGRDRLTQDVAAFSPGGQALAWDSSAAIRLNLWLTGVELFRARPWLGWGPGTDGNKVLVPMQVVEFSPSTLANAPDWSHMHSVVIEALVRFGATSLLIALPLTWLLLRAGRSMWTTLADRDPRLRELLVLTALMTLLFLFYEYRLVHVDMRFFVQLFLGIWYSFWLHQHSLETRS